MHTTIEAEVDEFAKLQALEPECKWPQLAQVWLLTLGGAKEGEGAKKHGAASENVRNLLQALQVADPCRKEYYVHISPQIVS